MPRYYSSHGDLAVKQVVKVPDLIDASIVVCVLTGGE